MRRLLGVLRREDEALALAPQPSLRHVDDARAQAQAAGLPVELAVEGEARDLPTGVDLTAYRVVQEALAARVEPAAPGTPRARPLRRRPHRARGRRRRRRRRPARCSACTSACTLAGGSCRPARGATAATSCARGCRWEAPA